MTMGEEVYVVEAGEYSDYHIIGVFADRALAEKCAALMNGDVVVRPLNPYADAWNQGLRPFEVVMAGNGDAMVSEGHVDGGEDAFDTFFGWRTFHVWAESRGHAVKIANERRICLLAAGVEWPKRVAKFSHHFEFAGAKD